jgi:hypothetical protein
MFMQVTSDFVAGEGRIVAVTSRSSGRHWNVCLSHRRRYKFSFFVYMQITESIYLVVDLCVTYRRGFDSDDWIYCIYTFNW